MKIMIYGFKPFHTYKENITEKIIKTLKSNKNLVKVIFPVKFDEKMFLDEIKKIKPDFILGLGQCPRGRKIRIERKAVNLKKEVKEEKPKPIYTQGPDVIFVTASIKRDALSRLSYNAGNYVCNFSMYVILNYCKDKNIKFAFLHIPKDYPLGKAVRFIESKIKEIQSI